MKEIEEREGEMHLLDSSDIYSLYSTTSSSHPAIHLSITPPPHTLHHSDYQSIPRDLNSPNSSASTLLHALPFSTKPLTLPLRGKRTHTHIQCLLRHDGTDFYIKTDIAGLDTDRTISEVRCTLWNGNREGKHQVR